MDGGGARVAVIGGSGLYRFLPAVETLTVDTPYGPASDSVTLAMAGGRSVAFLPRHGAAHTIPPHRINYRANIWALRSLGVERVVAPCAAGSLRAGLRPGDVVVCDQLVDRTHSRADTYFDGPEVAHLAAADPYCPELRPLAARAALDAGLRAHPHGTVVVVQGPRFSTRAEARWFAAAGWDLVNMTQYPEAVLARELGMCYVTMSLVTDYDAGLEGHPSRAPVTQAEVLAVFEQNTERLRDALQRLVGRIPDARGCDCPASAPAPLPH